MEPVDLTNLREMTDGDTELEQALFQEFYACFEAGLAALSGSLNAESQEAWQKHAHALKGITLNLGAAQLGALCQSAQEHLLVGDDKEAALLLHGMAQEYMRVKTYLRDNQ